MTCSSFLCSPKMVLWDDMAKRRERMKNGSAVRILRWVGKDSGGSIDVWMMYLSISVPAMKIMISMICPASPAGCSPARSFLCSWVFILVIGCYLCVGYIVVDDIFMCLSLSLQFTDLPQTLYICNGKYCYEGYQER